MRAFKNSLIRILMTLSILALAACNLPTPKDREEAGENGKLSGKTASATFAVDAVSGDSLEDKTKSPFAFPEARIFAFKVCLKDTNEYKSIAGHVFQVEELNKKFSTDAAGCLSWSESVAYNYLADSKYVQINRTILATGLHRGARLVSMAINPWSHGESLRSVIDLSKEHVPGLVTERALVSQALNGMNASGEVTPHPIWVEDGRLFVTEQQLTQKGVVLLVEARTAPTIQLRKMNGDLILKTLTRGQFKAEVSMIHSYVHDGKEVRRLLGRSEETTARIDNGTMAVKAPIFLPVIPTRGQVILGLKLAPINPPEGLTPFEGIYMLGEYDQLKGASFLRVNALVAETPNFTLDSYVQEDASSLSISEKNEVNEDVYQTPKIEVRPLEFRFAKIIKETTTSRTINFNVRACINHGVDQRNTRAHTFTVTKFRKTADEVAQYEDNKTMNNSCINWSETVEFQMMACQQYSKGFVEIVNKDLGMNQRIEILINPWESNTDLFARDTRDASALENNIVDCEAEKRPNPLLKMDNFSYKTLSYQYQIDNNLGMSLVKRMQVRLDATLLSYSSLSRGYSDQQRLRDGIYVLKAAIVRNRDYDSNNTFVASDMKLVQVLNGQVNADMAFATYDLKALGNRNTLLLEMNPADESLLSVEDGGPVLKDKNMSLTSAIAKNVQLESPTYQGAIILNERDASSILSMVNAEGITAFFINSKGSNNSNGKNLIDQIIAQGQVALADRMARSQQKGQLATFVKENNLDYVNLKTTQNTKDPIRSALKITTVAGQAPDRLSEDLQIDTESVRQVIVSGQIPKATAQKLCTLWANDYFGKMYADRGSLITRNLRAALGMECIRMAQKDPGQFFQVDRRLLVKDLDAKYQNGYNYALGVGTSFSLNTAHTKSSAVSHSVSTKAGISKKFLDLFSVAFDYAYTMSWVTADSNTNSNSISVNGNTTMTVEQNVFSLRFKKYEQCAVVRVNPLLFIKDQNASWFKGRKDYVSLLNTALSPEELGLGVTRGLMLCEGELRQEPIVKTENYYLVAQEIGNSAQQQDSADARNRNFFMALRSTNDYQRFVLAIKGKSLMPGSATYHEQDPQLEAVDMMTGLFQSADPSYPGMYLLK
ncbi:hypothetical protein D3C87_123880 [compost metagenome]